MEIVSTEPQVPGPVGLEAKWNDSMFVFSRDTATGLSTWARIAQQPNDGATSTFVCVLMPDGTRFRFFDLGTFQPGHRAPDRWLGDGLEFQNEGDRIRIRYSAPQCDLDLTWTGFHPPVDFHKIMARFSEELGEINAEHVEQGGEVTGRVRVGDQELDLSGMGYRDHSWGHRSTGSMLAHRWMIGTVGPALSWSGVSILMDGGRLVKTGFVVRDGDLTPVTDMDITVATKEDGMSIVAADSTLHLMDGSSLEVALTDVQVGGVLEVPPLSVVESTGVAVADGKIGVGDCEVSNSLTGGTMAPPVLVTGGAVGQGITHFADEP